MNNNLSYSPDATKLGFADIGGGLQFANTLNLSPEVQKDIYYTAANRCRGGFIPTWAGENQFFPSSIPPVKCPDNTPPHIVLTDLNGHPLDFVDNMQVVGNNIQDLTMRPNKMKGLDINKKDILTFVAVGAGLFIIYKIFS